MSSRAGREDFFDLLASAFDQALEQVRAAPRQGGGRGRAADANERLEAVVQRQDALLREVNHRVANSLQLVSALVHMQAGAVTDDERARAP